MAGQVQATGPLKYRVILEGNGELFVPGIPCAVVIFLYRIIQYDCRGFNNLSYTIHLR